MQLARHYQTVRQPGRMGGDSMEGQKLVFLYPFAVDQSLGKYTNLCRDFFTVSFINEIKIENILNIVSTANTNVGTIGSGSKQINPAEMVYQTTQARRPAGSEPTVDLPAQEADPYFYKEKLDKFNEFLQIQLKKDPRYQKFRPVFSTITINQMLDIPLILGSKSYPVDSQFMYLLLMISIIYDIKWNTGADVRRAATILKGLEPGQFSKLIVSEDFRDQIEFVANVKGQTSKLKSEDSESTRAFKRIDNYIKQQANLNEIFFNIIFQKDKWESNFPEMTTGSNLSFNKVAISTRTQRRHYEQSINALNGYLSEYIVPLLHSFEIFTGPVDSTINVPEKIDAFITDIVEGLSDDFINLSNNINNGLINLNASGAEINDANVTSDNIAQMSALCEDNANLSYHVKQNLETLRKDSKLGITFDSANLMKFIDSVTTSGNKFHALGETVNSWLTFLSQNGQEQLMNSIHTIQSNIDNLIEQLLYKEYPRGTGHGEWIMRIADAEHFPLRHQNFCKTFGITSSKNPDLSSQYSYFKQAVGEVETALREIIIFFVKWVFFSYSCSYLKDVEIDVEIQKRDALEFPNYCLVLPYKLFRDLYVTQISRNFAKYLKSNDEDDLEELNGRPTNLNPNDINALFDVVSNRLNIPNLIVIDEQTKKCHYKFMYMLKPTTVNFTTMENFIKHQNDVLPGF